MYDILHLLLYKIMCFCHVQQPNIVFFAKKRKFLTTNSVFHLPLCHKTWKCRARRHHHMLLEIPTKTLSPPNNAYFTHTPLFKVFGTRNYENPEKKKCHKNFNRLFDRKISVLLFLLFYENGRIYAVRQIISFCRKICEINWTLQLVTFFYYL